MCACSAVHVLYSSFLVLLVSSAVGRASSYMRSYGAKKELWPYLRLRCDLRCPYGFETDVEGNYVCLCHDPCQNVICFGRARCVVELPKLCTRDYCRPRASCKDLSFPVPFLHNSQPRNSELDLLPLADDSSSSPSSSSVTRKTSSASSSSVTSLPARCRLPARTDVAGATTNRKSSSCRKMRVRWFYDDVTGTCRSFVGCKMPGNNFRGRRGCEKTCGLKKGSFLKKNPIYAIRKSDDVSLTSSSAGLEQPHPGHHQASECSQPVVPWISGCKKASRRWFYDQESGTCRKFRSCSRTGGNNFSRKRHCKNLCMQHRRARRKERTNHSYAANQ